MNSIENIKLTHSFFELGNDFYQVKDPDPVSAPYLVHFNPSAALKIGLDPAESERPEFAEYFSGNRPLANAKPLAMVYTGHQFGAYNPRLGDGRGLLLGEIINEAKETWDIHLKGCGPTRFARGFDGRATLRSSIREYLGGEAMHGLGIPTTRSLGIVGIGELIYREFPEPAAILIRLCQTHVRFGSFQHFHFSNNSKRISQLADYVIQRHFPEIEHENEKYRLLFREVIDKTASLIAQWQAVGFIHGVMNTDNMSILGDTFDYGPFGFMDRFNPAFTANLTDNHGRYAFGKQPEIAHWNLVKLGETLLHLMGPEVIQEEIGKFQPLFKGYYRALIGQKLGLKVLDEQFSELVGGVFKLLYVHRIDYTKFFRSLADFPQTVPDVGNKSFTGSDDLDKWLEAYRKLIEKEDGDFVKRREEMNQINPKFILRNYLLQKSIDLAIKNSDFSEIERLMILLHSPYQDQAELFDQHGIDTEYYSSSTPDSFIEMRLSCSA